MSIMSILISNSKSMLYVFSNLGNVLINKNRAVWYITIM
jgi:hypothetical protein